MRPLYQIENDLIALDAILDEHEGDLSKADPQITDWFNSLGDEVLVKADGVIDYCRQLRLEAEGAKAEAARWQAGCVTRNLKADRIEGALLAFLDRHGYRKLQTAKGRTISIAGNGGKRPVVFNLDVKIECPACGGDGVIGGTFAVQELTCIQCSGEGYVIRAFSPEFVDERFHKVTTEIDREKVRAALEAGESIPFAVLGDRGQHIRGIK